MQQRNTYIELIRELDADLEVHKRSEFGSDITDAIDALHAVNFLHVDDTTDYITVTTDGRLFAGIRPQGVAELPVVVAEVIGDVPEAEMAARYIDAKVAGVDRHAAHDHGNAELYQHVGIILTEIAAEFRQNMHVPSFCPQGRVIPYTEDRSTGLSHSAALQLFFDDVYARNVKAGWWTNIENGTPKKRNVGELFILMVTELAEAYRAYVNREQDDKLPEFPGVGVEMGDLMIRIADFCGAVAAGNVIAYDGNTGNPGEEMFFEICRIAERYEAIRKTPEAKGGEETADFIPAMNIGPMVDAKLAFNATRADHKIENRLKEDGKRT